MVKRGEYGPVTVIGGGRFDGWVGHYGADQVGVGGYPLAIVDFPAQHGPTSHLIPHDLLQPAEIEQLEGAPAWEDTKQGG